MNSEKSVSVIRKGWDMASGILGAGAVVILALLVISIIGLATFRLTAVTSVENYEYSYKFDRLAGKIERLNQIGYIVAIPVLEKVHKIDTRPMQVCISAIQRVLNCKLVQFNPGGLELFLQWHGRGDYSNEGGTREDPTTFNEILMAYAYEGSGKSYPFLTIIRELKSEEISEGNKR